MDEHRFRAFYDRTARRLRAYLVGATHDPTLADDLLQEAFFRYLRSGFSAEDEDHCKNYLYRIASNLVRDHWRRRKVREAPAEPSRTAIAANDNVDVRTDVGRALQQLKPRQRQLLWLAHVEGASHQEIGEILGLKPASVRSVLFRARQRLAEILRAGGFGPETGP